MVMFVFLKLMTHFNYIQNLPLDSSVRKTPPENKNYAAHSCCFNENKPIDRGLLECRSFPYFF